MKNNKILYIIIAILVLIIIGGGLFFFLGNKPGKNASVENSYTPAEESKENLSEQPDMAKFNEYFVSASLGKLPAGGQFDPFKVVKTKVFTSADQFCTSLEIKKTIKSGSIGVATYDVNKKEYIKPKTVFPMELKSGGSVGCESLEFPAGKYENKIYIDDVLTIVLTFEVK